MPALTLTEPQQAALRALMALEPRPGQAIPAPEFLGLLQSLLPCDAMGVGMRHNDGRLVDEVVLPASYAEGLPDPGKQGPLHVGIMHWGRKPAAAQTCGILPGITDGIAIGFRNGRDGVSQVWFDRLRHEFTDGDLAMLGLVAPVLQRLLRQRPTPRLPESLTVQERRVLLLVANAMSNDEIAAHLFVSVGTVRKHLENLYRKLGVHSRLAAVVALDGGLAPHLDRVEQFEKYAK
jgi:DNA-binding CsgD family transcriptional regulator